jgi:hypothetical protein
MTGLSGTVNRACLLTLALLSGCERRDVPSSPPADADRFAQEAGPRGLDFVYQSGQTSDYHMPEIMGGGAALFDMDGDGDIDAYLVQGEGNNQLFRNDGGGLFTDISEASGADDGGYGMGVACGDYDGDGDVDLYVTNNGVNRLLANDGAGRFTDLTEQARVGLQGWSTSSAFTDIDADGDLDLFVTQYLEWPPRVDLDCFNTMGGRDYCSPRNYFAPAQDVLYRNDGNGTFTQITAEAGMTVNSGTGLGVSAADFTGDQRVDIFVANDGMPDQLWVNMGENRFVDRGIEMGAAFDRDGRAAAGMGVAVADIDGDDDLDVIVGNLRNESDTLLRNDGGYFTNVTAAAGMGAASRRFTRFGIGWFDFDHDGLLDLYQANGRVMRQAQRYNQDPYAEPDLLYRGMPDGRFAPITLPQVGTGRAAAFGDVDDDGAVDVLVVNRDGPAHLLMNKSADGHWIGFSVLDEQGAPAIGAKVVLTANGVRIRRDVHSASSYLASNDPRVHVGLGTVPVVERVEVRWTDGETETFGPFDAGSYYPLMRGRGN